MFSDKKCFDITVMSKHFLLSCKTKLALTLFFFIFLFRLRFAFIIIRRFHPDFAFRLSDHPDCFFDRTCPVPILFPAGCFRACLCFSFPGIGSSVVFLFFSPVMALGFAGINTP
jgi:hypothetical protein